VRPIGKGARFLVLSGDLRGLEGTISGPDLDPARAGWWLLRIGPAEGPWSTEHLEGSMFQRLDDAPAEVDPLFAEIEEAAKGTDMEAIGGAGGIVDEMRNALNDIDDGESDEDWFASHRAAFIEVAALGLAGIRAIDRR
jgi:hypothetical protein